jgi:hypothetical protein
MKQVEIKTFNVEGEDFDFNLSIENIDFQFIIANIHITKNDNIFRKIDGSNKILEKILFFYLYEKLKKYVVLKIANIQTQTEYQGVFEIKNILKFESSFSRSVKLNYSEDEVTVNITIIEKEFKECINYIQNPINDSKIFINPVLETFQELILHCFIDEKDKFKLNQIGNSGETIIRKATDELFLEKFGQSFVAYNIGEKFCSHYELQQKFKIIPKILE